MFDLMALRAVPPPPPGGQLGLLLNPPDHVSKALSRWRDFYLTGSCQGYPKVLLLPLTSLLQQMVSQKTLKLSSVPSEGCREKSWSGRFPPSFSSQVHHIIASTHPAAPGCSSEPPDFRNLQPETGAYLLYTATLATWPPGKRVLG